MADVPKFTTPPPIGGNFTVAHLDDAWLEEASDYQTDIMSGAPVGQSKQTGTLDNIVRLFDDRYETLARIMRQECGFVESHQIAYVKRHKHEFTGWNAECNLIVMISDLGTTKKGNKRINVEDPSGEITIFAPQKNPMCASLLRDDVIGVTGSFLKDTDIFWVKRIQYPEVLMSHQNRGGEDYDPVSIAFASDQHMGSIEFMEPEWDKMMEWLNSGHPLAKNIKYFVFTGDVVEGVGVYPGQEKNLGPNSEHHHTYSTDMLNVYDQYEFFARKLDMLPDHINPIIIPGNHDAVRPAEPQPVLEERIQKMFNDATFIGNPMRAQLSGIDVLAYHGKGVDDMVPVMKHVTYEAPAEAMKEMLKKRHLAPIWGERNALSPEEEDQMVIRDVPDLFVTGHTHAHQVEWFRGLPLIVSSTFQNETDFMNMLGYKAKKCLLTVYNIRNRETKVIPFGEA